jgi:hypothetical protein
MHRQTPDRTTEVRCTEYLSRLSMRGERPITAALLRSTRRRIRSTMGELGARGSVVWRLHSRADSLIVTGLWHPQRSEMIQRGRSIRMRYRAIQGGLPVRRTKLLRIAQDASRVQAAAR